MNRPLLPPHPFSLLIPPPSMSLPKKTRSLARSRSPPLPSPPVTSLSASFLHPGVKSPFPPPPTRPQSSSSSSSTTPHPGIFAQTSAVAPQDTLPFSCKLDSPPSPEIGKRQADGRTGGGGRFSSSQSAPTTLAEVANRKTTGMRRFSWDSAGGKSRSRLHHRGVVSSFTENTQRESFLFLFVSLTL